MKRKLCLVIAILMLVTALPLAQAKELTKSLLSNNNDTLYFEDNSLINPTEIKATNKSAGKISAGIYHSMAIKTDGTLWTWGSNDYGQLGNGNNANSSIPIKIMDNVTHISAGGYHSMAIKTDGSLWAWGRDGYGQLGSGNNTNSNIPIKVMDNVAYVSAGQYHSMAIKTDGSLWTWGFNGAGHLGKGSSGSTTSSKIPKKIMDNVVYDSAGGNHSMAIKTDGSLWTWGSNDCGQLGNGSTTYSRTPIKIMDNVAHISAGEHSIAIKTDGSLWVWGNNKYGQLGNGSTTDSHIPIKIMNSVAYISAGSWHSMVIKTDGSLWTWGSNGTGQLGNGNTGSTTPIKIMENVAYISAGNAHSMAIKTDGSLWTWGYNWDGQLGNGSTTSSDVPIEITGWCSCTVPSDALSANNAYIFVADKDTLNPIDDATVSISSTQYGFFSVKTKKGLAEFPNLPNGKYNIEVTKTGYVGAYSNMELKRGTYATISIQKLVEGVPAGEQEALSVTCNGKDILNHSVKFKANINASLKIKISTRSAPSTISKYQLLQGGSTIKDSTNNEFALSSNDIKPYENVWVRIVYKDGRIGKAVRTYLSTYNTMGNIADETSLKIMDGKVKFTYPDGTTFLGGREFEIDLGYCPVEFEIDDDCSVKIGFGTKNLFNVDGDSLFKKLKLSTINRKIDKGLEACLDAVSGTVSFGWEAKPKLNIFGYAEGKIDEGGNFAFVGGEVVLAFKIKVKNSWQWVIGVIPVTGSVAVSAKLETTFQMQFSPLRLEGEFEIEGELKASIGVGVAEIFDLSVYGSVGAGFEYSTDTDYARVMVEGEFGFKGTVLFLENTWPLWSGSHTIWEDYFNKSDPKIYTYGNKMGNPYDTSEYSLIPRDYLKTQSGWKGFTKSAADNTIQTLQSDIYTEAQPKLVSVGDKNILVYLADDGSRSTGNHIALMYSVCESNGTWSEPKYVYNDGTADFYPQLATDGENIFVTWQNMNAIFNENVTIEQLCAASEVAFAKFDNETNTFVDAKNITDNSVLDMQPQIHVSNGIPYITWSRSANNDMFAGPNTIMYSIDNGAEQTFTTIDTQALSLDIGIVNGDISIAFTTDKDGDLVNTTNDTALYCGKLGTNPVSIDDGEEVKANASFNVIGGQNALCYISDNTLKYTFDCSSTQKIDVDDDFAIGGDYSLVSNGANTCLIFMANSENSSAFYLRSYNNETKTWSNSVKITDNEGYVKYANATYDSKNNMTLVFTRSDVTMSEGNMDLKSDLCTMNFVPTCDISLEAVEFDYDDAMPAELIPVDIIVANNGIYDVDRIKITVSASGLTDYVTEIDANLVSGQSAQYQINYTLPNAFTGRKYIIKIEPTSYTDSNMVDNSHSLDLECADLEIEVEKLVSENNNLLLVTVRNCRFIPTGGDLILKVGDESTDGISLYTINELQPGDSAVIRIDNDIINAFLTGQETTMCLSVTSDVNEYNIGNNNVFVDISKTNIYYSVVVT
ncbi:MAG: hypothetical protein GX802_08480, partial [Clostridiales bacterium]|nr:hypothetical protein [Clostridiales bacterium]